MMAIDGICDTCYNVYMMRDPHVCPTATHGMVCPVHGEGVSVDTGHRAAMYIPGSGARTPHEEINQ